jgi:2-iminobutanoate/2-iminopropanoate deaminase
MRRLCVFALVSLVGCSALPGAAPATTPAVVTRYQLNPWEADIGYSQVVQAGNSFYISGIACAGADYTDAVASCYRELGEVLAKFELDAGNVVKETIYTRNIEALKLQIPARKAFYGGQYPAATWVQIERLYNADHLLEIELEAVKSAR